MECLRCILAYCLIGLVFGLVALSPLGVRLGITGEMPDGYDEEDDR